MSFSFTFFTRKSKEQSLLQKFLKALHIETILYLLFRSHYVYCLYFQSRRRQHFVSCRHSFMFPVSSKQPWKQSETFLTLHTSPAFKNVFSGALAPTPAPCLFPRLCSGSSLGRYASIASLSGNYEESKQGLLSLSLQDKYG